MGQHFDLHRLPRDGQGAESSKPVAPPSPPATHTPVQGLSTPPALAADRPVFNPPKPSALDKVLSTSAIALGVGIVFLVGYIIFVSNRSKIDASSQGILTGTPTLSFTLESTPTPSPTATAAATSSQVETSGQVAGTAISTPRQGSAIIKVLNGSNDLNAVEQVNKALQDGGYTFADAGKARLKYSFTYVYYKDDQNTGLANDLAKLLVGRDVRVIKSGVTGNADVLVVVGNK